MSLLELVPELQTLTLDGSLPSLNPKAAPLNSGRQHVEVKKIAMVSIVTTRVSSGSERLDEEEDELSKTCGGHILENFRFTARRA